MELGLGLMGAFQTDCAKCRRVPDLREAWGCEEPAPDPFGYHPCPECFGRDDECERCDGDSDGIPVHRCPSRVGTDEAFEMTGYFASWKRGVMPASGGILNQTARYVASMQILEFCEGLVAKEHDEEMKKAAAKRGRK